MAHGFKNVSKNHPCPICGKPDWCGWQMDSDGRGDYTIVCQRPEVRGNVAGKDGNFYVFISETSGGAYRYEEAAQCRRRREQWCQEHGYKYKGEAVAGGTSSGNVIRKSQRVFEPVIVDDIEPKSHEELDKIYRCLLQKLILEEIHTDYLKKEGWDNNLIEENLIRSFPERDFVRCKFKNYPSGNIYRKRLAKELEEKFGKGCLKGVPGAYIDHGGCWTFAGPKGILFPLYDTKGLIYGLRIRMDFLDYPYERKSDPACDDWYTDDSGINHFVVPMKGTYIFSKNGEKEWDKSGGKYRPFTSYKVNEEEYEKGFVKNCYKEGCELRNQVGVYWHREKDTSFLCYLTEGEKKGIFANKKLHSPVISFPGVSSWAKLFMGKKGERLIDLLAAAGVKMFVVAYDADKAVNKAVLRQQHNLIEKIKEEGFMVATAEWDVCNGKGLDDLLAAGIKPGYELVA